MIVRAGQNTLYLISQPDHATLARRVMERWAPLYDVDRRASILLAIEEHDNGWRELDAVPTVDAGTGRILDFVHLPAADRQGVWPRGVNRIARDDEWAAALVAQHAITIYSRFAGDPEWALFFPEMERRRDDLVRSASRTFAQLTHDYVFVRVGDLISLMFCAGWDEPQAHDRWTFRREGSRVIVSPDAFGEREVPVAVTAREIPSRPYADGDEVRRVIRQSPVVTLSGVVAGDLTVAV